MFFLVLIYKYYIYLVIFQIYWNDNILFDWIQVIILMLSLSQHEIFKKFYTPQKWFLKPFIQKFSFVCTHEKLMQQTKIKHRRKFIHDWLKFSIPTHQHTFLSSPKTFCISTHVCTIFSQLTHFQKIREDKIYPYIKINK